MVELMRASHQWATRPNDERYTSLTEMLDHFKYQKDHSSSSVVPSKTITLLPDQDNTGLSMVGGGIAGRGEEPFALTHWSFGQLAALAEAPPGYLRTLPSPLSADCINYGLRFKRDISDVGLFQYSDGHNELRAATGPNYGRIWNADVVEALIDRFGNGVDGDWRVPGEFGKAVKVTKANTTLYASDRDMFVFLADEKNRIEVPNRRNGKKGPMARGFFSWNSEVGKTSQGTGFFLFDYVCKNRIVWGAEMLSELRIRHTASAPTRWLDEVQPVLTAYAEGSTKPIEDAIKAAQAKKVEDVNEFLAERFGKRMAPLLTNIHVTEEGRPIETLWDVTTAVTAYARGIPYIDARVELERRAGDLIALAA